MKIWIKYTVLIILMLVVLGIKVQAETTYNVTGNICGQTLEYIKVNGQSYSTDFENFVTYVNMNNNRHYNVTDLKEIIYSWQPLCSDIVKRTLYEKDVCDSIFFFLINNEEWNTYSKISALTTQINERVNISQGLVQYYTKSYSQLCPQLNNKPLPQKGTGITNFTLYNGVGCVTDINNSFFQALGIDSGISIPNYYIESTDCRKVKNYKWIFKIERTNQGFKITELRAVSILIIFFLILCLITVKLIYSNLHTNRRIQQVIQ